MYLYNLQFTQSLGKAVCFHLEDQRQAATSWNGLTLKTHNLGGVVSFLEDVSILKNQLLLWPMTNKKSQTCQTCKVKDWHPRQDIFPITIRLVRARNPDLLSHNDQSQVADDAKEFDDATRSPYGQIFVFWDVPKEKCTLESKESRAILLIEEIRHHFGCIKPCK